MSSEEKKDVPPKTPLAPRSVACRTWGCFFNRPIWVGENCALINPRLPRCFRDAFLAYSACGKKTESPEVAIGSEKGWLEDYDYCSL